MILNSTTTINSSVCLLIATCRGDGICVPTCAAVHEACSVFRLLVTMSFKNSNAALPGARVRPPIFVKIFGAELGAAMPSYKFAHDGDAHPLWKACLPCG